MAYWWVSQNQTYDNEVGGGYLWAPQLDKRGNVPHHWAAMLQVQVGDIVFSYQGTKIRQLGVALSAAYIANRPIDFGKNGLVWQESGWKVDILYTPVALEIQPRQHPALIGLLLASPYSPIQKSGDGNQGYLFSISDQAGLALINLTGASVPDLPVLSLDQIDFDHSEQEIIAQVGLRETEKATLVLARRGQGLFRSRVASIEDHCRVTGLDKSKFLVASHIKPWSVASNEERTDGNNGLFLSPHVDKLFDGGFISFTKTGKLLVSDSLPADVLQKWSIRATDNFGKFNSDQAFFLDFHQREIFGKA